MSSVIDLRKHLTEHCGRGDSGPPLPEELPSIQHLSASHHQDYHSGIAASRVDPGDVDILPVHGGQLATLADGLDLADHVAQLGRSLVGQVIRSGSHLLPELPNQLVVLAAEKHSSLSGGLGVLRLSRQALYAGSQAPV